MKHDRPENMLEIVDFYNLILAISIASHCERNQRETIRCSPVKLKSRSES